MCGGNLPPVVSSLELMDVDFTLNADGVAAASASVARSPYGFSSAPPSSKGLGFKRTRTLSPSAQVQSRFPFPGTPTEPEHKRFKTHPVSPLYDPRVDPISAFGAGHEGVNTHAGPISPYFSGVQGLKTSARQGISSQYRRLNWRDDPSENNSDMTIEIVRAQRNTTESFPVHRGVLTSGPGKSRYFYDVLNPGKPFNANPASPPSAPLSSKGQAVSVRVTLDDRVVDLIPQFLDYVYSLPSFRLSVDNVMGLRFLSDLFKIPRLHDATWNFIRQEIRPSNLVALLTEANYYSDSQVASWVAFEFAERIMEFDEGSPLLSLMSPGDFKQAISLARRCRTGKPLHVARLTAAYCAANIKILDEGIFRELTCAEDLPMIDRPVALKLMELEFLVVRKDLPSQPSPDHLSCLQDRCVKVLAGTAK